MAADVNVPLRRHSFSFRFSYFSVQACLIDLVNADDYICFYGYSMTREDFMSDLKNTKPALPEDEQAVLRKNKEESEKLDSPERTNDSTVDPTKPKREILKGFHGG